MKIAVYTITKNEEQQVESYMENTKEADGVFILDTGSTDNTVSLLKSKGAVVETKVYDYFRFDEALNDSITIVPDDYNVLISLNLDERLTEGWREKLEEVLKDNYKNPFVLYFQYVNSWKDKEQTIPGVIYKRNKIHSKKGISWIYPIFEILSVSSEVKVLKTEEVIIHHYQKERTERDPLYENLAKEAIAEDPNNPNYYFSYAEILYSIKKYQQALRQWGHFLEKTDQLSLDFSGISQRRSIALRNMALCQQKINSDPNLELVLLLRAMSECPFYREIWIYLAQSWMNVGNNIQAIACMETAMSIKDRSRSMVLEEWCWDEDVLKKLSSSAKMPKVPDIKT